MFTYQNCREQEIKKLLFLLSYLKTLKRNNIGVGNGRDPGSAQRPYILRRADRLIEDLQTLNPWNDRWPMHDQKNRHHNDKNTYLANRYDVRSSFFIHE